MEISKTTDSTGEENKAPETEEQPRGPYVPLDGVDSTSPAEHADETRIESFAASGRGMITGADAPKVDITTADKDAFVSAVVSGGRFVSRTRLFNGKVDVVFRSRSLEETEAILAYMQRNGISGKFTTKADVQDASLLALLVASVESINGVSYPEMRAPLRYTETLDGVKDPAWVEDLEIWRKKPDALLAALGDALVEFEAKYWAMTKAAKDENFWNPDGSTGK